MSATSLARIVLAAALVFTLAMALSPQGAAAGPEIGDKYLHMLAFGTLAGLARAAFPGARAWVIGERLSFLGALIEVFQSIPALHRDCDPLDWLADTAAVAVVLLAIGGARRFAPRAAGKQASTPVRHTGSR